MNLYNHTKIDDKILERVLYRAAKAVGSIRTAKVVIKVTNGKYRLHGKVIGYNYYQWFLKSKRHTWIKSKKEWRLKEFNKSDKRLIYSDGGTMFLTVPIQFGDELSLAQNIYELAAHEWRHIRDKQKYMNFSQYNRNHDNRPHERRAINSANKASRMIDKRDDIQEAILDLGIEIERIRKQIDEDWNRKTKDAKGL